jgi:hypothetical protein
MLSCLMQLARPARNVRDPRRVLASSMSCKSVTQASWMAKCANSASEPLRKLKKTFGTVSDSRTYLSVSSVSLAAAAQFR